jgi:hypothetical protein
MTSQPEDDPVTPSDPEDHGVRTQSPEQMQVEAGRLLANHARERLRSQGFEDDQIERWAQTYIAETGAGSTDDFVDWVAERQRAEQRDGSTVEEDR